MADFLYYRFPQKEAVYQCGLFHPIEELKNYQGFFIRPFQSDVTYGFQVQENSVTTKAHDAKEKPFTISRREYLMETEGLVNSFDMFQIQKLVYSRVKKVNVQRGFDVSFFDHLCELYPNAFVYAVSSEQFGTWIGASPEISLKQIGHQFFTVSLAGTKKSLQEPWGQKEIEEQTFVTDFILERLQQLQVKDLEVIGPYDYSTGMVYHLKSDIAFTNDQYPIWRILNLLDPTPAVSGVPQDLATRLILEMEPHDRQLYTGLIGEIKTDEASVFVNLRCAQWIDQELFLYVGGGFTKNSIPELEWEETENKAKTLERIFYNA